MSAPDCNPDRDSGVLSSALFGDWVDNCFVTPGEIMTVLDDGTLEIRGDGWGATKRERVIHEGSDLVRTCKIGDANQARRIAEEIARILYSPNAEVSEGGPLTHESPAAQSRRSLH